MRTFNSYEDAIIGNAGMDLRYLNIDGKYIDKKSGVYVRINNYDKMEVRYENDDISKWVTVDLYREDRDHLYINLEVKRNCITESAGIILCDGITPISIYDKSVFFADKKPLCWISIEQGKYVVSNCNTKERNKISVKDFTNEGLVNIIYSYIANAHTSENWENEINSLFELIRPVLKMCVEDSVEELKAQIEVILEQIQNRLKYTDKQIENFQIQRMGFIQEYNAYQEAQNILRSSEAKESDNQRKK